MGCMTGFCKQQVNCKCDRPLNHLLKFSARKWCAFPQPMWRWGIALKDGRFGRSRCQPNDIFSRLFGIEDLSISIQRF